jgi:Trypsin-co-occurring domain 1
MSELQKSELRRFLIQEGDKEIEIYVESPPLPSLPVDTSTTTGKRPGAMGPGGKDTVDEVMLRMEEIQEKIQTYAKFAIGAFQHLGAAEVEEISLKFGGKTGIIFTEGSAEGSMEVSVKCKFPKSPVSES